jgi:hypothetical protein
MDTNIASAGNALHLHLEVQNSLGLEDVVENRCSVSETLIDRVAQIALQAARVVVQRVGVGSDTTAGEVKSGRAQIHLHVLERAGLDTAAARASGKVDGGETTRGTENNIGLVRDEFAVTRERQVTAIEDRRLVEAAEGCESPVPVLSEY